MPAPRTATPAAQATSAARAAAPRPAGAPSRPAGGPGPEEGTDGRIRRAALEVLAETGYDRLTMDAVAATARASKATLYRRWPSKAELVVDALSDIEPAYEPPDTGSLRSDLEAAAAELAERMDPFRQRLVAGLVSALPRHPDLRRVFQERFVTPRAGAVRTVLQRAVARGEVPASRDLEMLVPLVPSLIFHRLILTGEPVDRRYLSRILEEVLIPLATSPAETHHRRTKRRP